MAAPSGAEAGVANGEGVAAASAAAASEAEAVGNPVSKRLPGSTSIAAAVAAARVAAAAAAAATAAKAVAVPAEAGAKSLVKPDVTHADAAQLPQLGRKGGAQQSNAVSAPESGASGVSAAAAVRAAPGAGSAAVVQPEQKRRRGRNSCGMRVVNTTDEIPALGLAKQESNLTVPPHREDEPDVYVVEKLLSKEQRADGEDEVRAATVFRRDAWWNLLQGVLSTSEGFSHRGLGVCHLNSA